VQVTLNSYVNYLRAGKDASEHTVKTYRAAIEGNQKHGKGKGFFQFLFLKNITTLDAITRQTLRDYMYWLMEQGMAKRSIANRLSAIRSFFRYLQREGIVSENPLEKISSPKLDKRLPDILTSDEMERLLETPGTSTPAGQRDKAIIELLYASGLRVSEIVRLDTKHIDLQMKEIRVTGKGNKERIVLIGEPAAEALRGYLHSGRIEMMGERNTDAVFINRLGRRIIARRVQKILDKHALAAGIERRVHPHILRHTFATHMLDGGADLRVVQELLGHSSLSTTQIYTHVSKSQAKKVYLSAHPLALEGITNDGK